MKSVATKTIRFLAVLACLTAGRSWAQGYSASYNAGYTAESHTAAANVTYDPSQYIDSSKLQVVGGGGERARALKSRQQALETIAPPAAPKPFPKPRFAAAGTPASAMTYSIPTIELPAPYPVATAAKSKGVRHGTATRSPRKSFMHAPAVRSAGRSSSASGTNKSPQ